MSGHSKWATIHRQKGLKDAARGNLFSKLARAITIAAKTGGGPNPDSNFKLRVAIDKARQSNMPKENIERALSKAAGGDALEEVSYEGFGPGGTGIIVEVATDNRNRTSAEIKNVFERGGGRLAGPGSVSFNFEPKGMILVEKGSDPQSQMLGLIDIGVEDVEETDDGIEAYVAPHETGLIREKIEKVFKVISSELVQKPRNYVTVSSEEEARKVLNLLGNLHEHEDVQKVFANVDIPEQYTTGLSN